MFSRFKSAIESGNANALSSTSRHYLKTKTIDETFTEVQGFNINPLAYALWLGQEKSFKFIHTRLNAKISVMESLFEKYEISSLHIVCAKGYTDLLRHYLPFYIEENTEFPEVQEIHQSRISYLISDESVFNSDAKTKYQPIHLAVIQEQIPLLTFVFKFFETRSFVPKTLDLEYKEELSGENCALLACRFGKYKMIMFLHKTCKSSFRVKNHSGMNAINVLIEGAKGKIDKNYFFCLQYLVEKIGIDVEYRYQFNLKYAEDEETVRFLEYKLRDIGNFSTRKEILQQEEDRFQNPFQSHSFKSKQPPAAPFQFFESETPTLLN